MQDSKNLKHLVIIDGLNFFFRAYHAVRPLSRASDGLPTNALYGFTQMLLKVIKDLQPDMCVVALDSIGNTFRKDIYPEYKAHRKEIDEEMKLQLPYLDKLVQAFAIQEIRVEGFEADDVIATLSEKHKNTHKVTILSSDKDLMQLINDNVSMYDTMKTAPDGSKGKFISYNEVAEKFDVTPDKVIEVQALIGDTSDNIPGVRSVGPKTASKLINQFGDLENLYAQLEETPTIVPREKLRNALLEHKDNAFMSKQLVTLKIDVTLPAEATDEAITYTPDLEQASHFLEELEFNSLAKRVLNSGQIVSREATTSNRPKSITNRSNNLDDLQSSMAVDKEHSSVASIANVETVNTTEQLQSWVAKIKKHASVAVDTETTGLDAMQVDLVGISLAICKDNEVTDDSNNNGNETNNSVKKQDELESCYIPLTHSGGDMFSDNNIPQLATAEVLKALAPIFTDKTITKVGQNFKYDLHIFHRQQNDSKPLEFNNIQDTMLMSFCLYGGLHGHGMDELALRYLGYECIKFKDICGTGKKQITFDKVDIPTATQYAAEDAEITLKLYNLFKAELAKPEKQLVRKIYEDIELPLLPTLARMEEDGVLIDSQRLQELSAEFGGQLIELEAKIYALAGEEFNIASPKQLGEILFDKLSLSIKGKNAKKSTNVKVMEELGEQGHEIATHVLEYRGLAKLKSTYSDALIKQINPRTGRIHTSYHQIGASTGRFSSSAPNLQNIPTRSENGRKIRSAFIAKSGYTLLRCDYSQIELRLLAHVSNSATLQEAFNSGADIHTFTAHQVFNVPLEEVTKQQRATAKTINFGLVYGMGSTSLAKQIGVTRQEAKQYTEDYFARYDGVKACLDGYIEFAQEHGYVETIYGRRIHIPDIKSSHPMMRAGAERAAINAPLQGANADIIKLVMPIIEQKLLAGSFKAKMLLQVHDELIFEVPEGELAEVEKLVIHEMESIVQLSIPLKVEGKHSHSWG